MKGIILHISDIHIKETSCLVPPEKVAATIRQIPDHIDLILILVTGDIAFSGIQKQYDIALDFFVNLIEEIKKISKAEIKLFFVPGNHDCNFTGDQSLRNLVVEKIHQNSDEPTQDSYIEQCLDSQQNFFDFVKIFGQEIPEATCKRLIWQESFDCKGKKITILQINSSWISKLNEEQGGLIFPKWDWPTKIDGDIVLACFHHPYTWFKSTCARELRQELDNFTDIVLTGHEHESEAFSKTTLSGNEVSYIEGAVFGDPHCQASSSFNIVEFNSDNPEYDVHFCDWKGKHYEVTTYILNESKFLFNRRSSKRSSFRLNIEFLSQLKFPGINISHPKKTIELRDIFILPNLRTLAMKGDKQTIKREFVNSENVIERLLSEKKVVISGGDFAGRTTLAKYIFIKFEEDGFVPLLVNSERIKNSKVKHFKNVLENALQEQYDSPNLSEYWQKSMEEKILLLDDFQDIPLNEKARADFAEWCNSKFDFVFFFSKNRSQIEEAILSNSTKKTWGKFKHFNIAPLSSHQKELLIEKWVLIGDPSTTSQEDLLYLKKHYSRMVNTVIGNNLLPSYPIFVLLILQQLESSKKLNTDCGAFGYYYELIINQALEEGSSQIIDLDTKIAFLEEIAWIYFESDALELDHEKFDRILAAHWSKYRLIGNPNKTLQELIDSRIIGKSKNTYFFFQKFMYYYFLARYMRARWTDDNIKMAFSSITENIHLEKNAKIIVFLTYLFRDRSVISILLENSKKVFAEFSPFELDKDFSFLDKFSISEPKVCLPDNDPLENRKNMLKHLEKIESAKDDFQNPQEDEPEPELYRNLDNDDEDIKNLLMIAKANKYVQILGQILRNFSGFLEGDLKKELAQEAFSIGLRSLTVYSHVLEKNLGGVVNYFSEMFGNKLENMPETKIQEFSQHLVYFISEINCLNTIKSISSAVGSERLIPTFEDVERSYSTLSTEFIQTMIRLDHFKAFPEQMVLSLSKKTSKLPIAKTLLRMIVTQHFYLFPRDRVVRQRVCDRLKIELHKGRIPMPE